MKKIALFSLLVCLCGIYVVPALAGSCEQRTVKKFSVIGGEWNTSDDYLYVSVGQYNSRMAYACETNGDSKNCSHGTKIAVRGSHYVGNAPELNFGLWQCYTESAQGDKDDQWLAFDAVALPECDQNKLKAYEKFLSVNDDVDIYCGNVQGKGSGSNQWCVNDMCRYRPCTTNCNDDDNPVVVVDECDKWKKDTALYNCCINARNGTADVTFKDGKCECKDKETKKWDPNTGKCEDTQVKPAYCDQFKAYPERYACCIAGKATTWEGAPNNGKCKCTENGKEWKYDAKTKIGKCEGGQSNEDDNSQECWYTFGADMKCANGNSYSKAQKYLLGYYDEQTCKKFIQQYNADAAKVLELFKKFCETQGTTYIVVNNTPSGPDATAVSNAKDTLNKFFASAESEASVWKDSEGKFNTARLASDLTAGVVLGTVGGVVSGVVIKKKQVEKGFEVLHCAVGGQKIADWGDEFSVGLQR